MFDPRPHNCRLKALRGTAWVGTVILYFVTMPQMANAGLIIHDYSVPVAELSLPGDEFLNWRETESHPTASGARRATPSEHIASDDLPAPSPGDRIPLWDFATDKGPTSGGSTSSPKGGTFPVSHSDALPTDLNQLPTVTLVTWIQLDSFLFVPEAQGSGLKRPPRTFTLSA